jgi:hypothetical protein
MSVRKRLDRRLLARLRGSASYLDLVMDNRGFSNSGG